MLDVGGKHPQPMVTHAIFRIVEGKRGADVIRVIARR